MPTIVSVSYGPGFPSMLKERGCRCSSCLMGRGVSEWFQVDSTVAALASEHRIEPWIVLAIDRAHPTAIRCWHVPMGNSHTSSRARFFRRRARRFRGVRSAPPLPILGYSYGGLSAVASAIAAPDVFGRVIAMSPSLWVQERAIMTRFEDARVLPSRLWIDVGSAEPDEGDLIPYMVSDARNLRDLALHRRMIFGRDVGYLEAMGEGHDMRAGGASHA